MMSKVHFHRLSYDPCSPLTASPLSSSATAISSPLEPGHSTTLPNPLEPPSLGPQTSSSPPTSAQQPGKPLTQDKDLSFLLDPSIYHPLSQLDKPLPLRQQLPSPPTADTPLPDSLTRLDTLLSNGKFLSVASLAASILVSGSVQPNDSKTIFDLLALRYSCLE